MGPKIRCLALFLVFTMIFIGVAGCASKGTSSQTLDPAGSSQPGPGASSGSQATHPVDPEPAVPTPGAGPGLAIPGALPEPPDGIGEPGKDFTVLQTGPADDWQGMAVPKFNPLGSQALYEDVQFLGDDVEPVPFYFLDGYTEKRETMLGERWELVIADPDYSLRWLRWYTREAGGQWYAGTQDHSTFTIKESDQVSWWADARQLDGKVEISVIKINTLPLSTWLTLRPGSLDSERFVFHTPPADGGLQSATLKLAGPETCGVSLSVGSSSLRHGFEYETDLRFDPAQLMRQKTDTFILDDLPIAEGWLCWQLNWDQDTPVPDEITIRLDTVAAIEPVRWGAQPGAIRLTGIPPGGSATVQVPGWAQVTHRDAIISDRFLAGSVDNNGDMLFTAPAGYYLVGLPSGAGGDAIGMSLLRLVPVHAGEITTVIVPAAASVGAGALSRLYGDFEDNEGGVDLLAAQADGAHGMVSLILNDPLERDLVLHREDIAISEDGIPAVITDVRQEIAGSDVVLVLDSSGSMGENMKPCVAAAKQFVASLPQNTSVRLIQFAQKITEHKGQDPASVIKALDSIKEGGATALYDATARAVTLLAETKRGYVVVFSDGADSREPGVDGEGSKIAKEQLFEQIGQSTLTVFTIGFGKGHDPSTLIAMSQASKGGAYFPAADKTALVSAFASVAGRFGNQFTVTYERPAIPVAQNSTIPVVSMIIDRSGSMNMEPDPADNVGWRLDRIKAMFHDFILALPAGTLMQLGSFAEPMGGHEPQFDQLITDQKAPVLNALGSLKAGGGTPTKKALEMAYYNLVPIPSQKRVLVFFTDAGLYDQDNPLELDDILAKFKGSGITVLFAGLSDMAGSAELDVIFQTAAQKAGGDYILTDDIDQIAAKLRDLLARIQEPAVRQGVDFTLGVDVVAGDGGRLRFYTARNLPDFKPLTGQAEPAVPQVVGLKTGEPYAIYDADAARLLYGSDQPGSQSQVVLRVPFSKAEGSNQVSRLSVSDAFLLDRFKGLPAPEGQMFLALNTTLAFAGSSSGGMSAYQVPSIFNHIYVSLNDGRMMPPSQATWLAEQPFALPGEEDVAVSARETRNGMLVFLVDWTEGDSLTQLSLHLYDTSNGHIAIPLAGRLSDRLLAMDALPQQAPVQMGQAFSLAVTGVSEQKALAGFPVYPDEQASTSFRVLEATFGSNVQALLDIDPSERFFYQIETNSGVLMTPMSDVVRYVPLGFSGRTMLAPGSCSQVRLPYVLPDAWLGAKAALYADLADGSQRWPLSGGQAVSLSGPGQTFHHALFDLTINALAPDQANSSQVVLDFTLHDKQDGEGTGGLDSILQLERNDAPAEELVLQAVAGRSGLGSFGTTQENVLAANAEATGRLIFSAIQGKGIWGAFDGQSRRGILIFSLPDDDTDAWSLTSPLLPDLHMAISQTSFPDRALLAVKPEIPIDDTFDLLLAEAVNGAVAAYQATHSDDRGKNPVGLSDAEILGEQVPAPALTLYGSQQIQAVQSDADFLALMSSLGYLPDYQTDSTCYRYAPEAVITQGWGGPNDLAVLAKTLLARLGYKPDYRTVRLTTEGQAFLSLLSGAEESPRQMIGVAYQEANGSPKLFVPGFSADLSELGGLAYLASDDAAVEIQPAMGHIEISLFGKLTGQAADLMAAHADLWGAIGDAMSDEEGNDSAFYESVTILDRELSLPELSLDALDISYLAKPKSDGSALLLALLDTCQGLIYDAHNWVDSSYYAFERLHIKLTENGNTVVHTTMLSGEQKLNEITHTLAWNVPELTSKAAGAIESMAQAKAAATSQPASYSVTRWLGHATIARLVMGLGEAGAEISGSLGIPAGRTSQSVALLVTSRSDGRTADTHVDLVNHRNQLHAGDENVRHAFNLIYGLFASDMEAAALPGGSGYGYAKVWASLPANAKLIPIAIEDQDMLDVVLEQNPLDSFPPLLLERMRGGDSDNPPKVLYLVPDKPAQIQGKARWAWLEIDMTSYDVVSVFETGERAGMGEYLIGCFPGNGNYGEVGVGLLVGIATSVGSVAAFALTGEDYKVVLQSAKNLAQTIGAEIGIVTGVTGGIDAAGKIGEAVGGTALQLEKLFEANEGIWVNKLTFTDGYNYAVEAYFKQAQPPEPPEGDGEDGEDGEDG